jgi:RimJ/RimL family protein N-acetyltransferase
LSRDSSDTSLGELGHYVSESLPQMHDGSVDSVGGTVRLVPYTDADLALTVALEADPTVKADLGGPIPAEEAERIHRHRLERTGHGDVYFTIVPAGARRPVGVAAVFETAWGDGVIHEAGVMLLPQAQRGGLGLTVLRMLTEHARSDGAIAQLHGFTAVTNRGGNELCRRLGWRTVGECDLDYEGRPVRCNHWVLDLARRA